MKKYSQINNLIGWIIFGIAATVYGLTIEPTASFWDCPEFITTGYKLEVGHPPGAPFFMLVANLFSQFASDSTTVAKMVNYMSALMSAACILFLFWSITHLVKKLVVKDDGEVSLNQLIIIMGSGAVGALAYTFSDTFWFSAVEGEVYAFSSLFTAVVFWLILKWEDVADQPYAERWLILIAYLTGLSIGVHLLNLLCLPAIVLVYYYKKTERATAKGSLIALAASAVLVAVVLYGIVPGIVKVGGGFELLFVNVFGLPFNSGVIAYILLLAAVLIWGIYETIASKSYKRMSLSFLTSVAMLGIPFYGHGGSSIMIGVLVLALLAGYLHEGVQQKLRQELRASAHALNTILLCTLLIVIGYSSYAVIVIRSTANTPMDQNSPEDIFTLGEYLGREQYGTRPLFYGPAYTSQVSLEVKDGYCEPEYAVNQTKYVRKVKESSEERDTYVEIPGRREYKFAQNMFFPRMYSSLHADRYEAWQEIKGHNVPYDKCGQMVMVKMPTQWENLKFFISYQVNWMYWRYFMWNFVGRQNDIQNISGEIEHGNWITGISWIDNLLLGDQTFIPDELGAGNKGHNVFYALPLLLGIIGLLWQAYRGDRGIRQFWVVFFLFFMTGLAIVLYLNQTPAQPRERDYAYAGSFYAFAIWIGMGVAGLAQLVEEYLKKNTVWTSCLVTLLCLLVPVQMASQTWDDHDRSGRYFCSDFGKNYLMSLPEEGNPVIFTNGDNDTFPLWYNQETEGFRTDARTCNLSYLNTDWYIDQMLRPSYESPALPISWSRKDYGEGVNDYVRVVPEYKKSIEELYKTARHQVELAEKGLKEDPDNPSIKADADALHKVERHFGKEPFELKNILRNWVLNTDDELRMIPTDSIVLTVDKDAVRRSGMLIPGDSIPDKMVISLKGKHALYKNELMILELLSQMNWERPLFMAVSVGSDSHLGLTKYFIQEGLAYRFTPFDSSKTGVRLDSEKMYDNLMNKFRYGNLEQPGLYIDENAMRMCASHRRIFSQLITQLVSEDKKEKAEKALDYCLKVIPEYNVPYRWENGAAQLAESSYMLGKTQLADDILLRLIDNETSYLTWYLSLDKARLVISSKEFEYHLAVLDALVEMFKKHPESSLNGKSTETGYKFEDMIEDYYQMFSTRLR
ncbi:MAG: DUF2723 domain-containing protein [Bacteroidales bacterium]|nr:DUF2723 domain-containing protein [Bacteroidales bacterium]